MIKTQTIHWIITTFILFLALCWDCSPLRAEENDTWYKKNDLIPDSTVTWGKLENGFRYAIMPNIEPPDRVSLRLLVNAGSLMENDDQLGLAHFLEHMAFNGTINFPAGELVEYFQRLGMGFGADTNAYTSFDKTVYMLELPRNDELMLDDGLKLLRDYADGILLKDEEIDKERGVILSEKRARDSVEYRIYKAEMTFVMPESLAVRRFPIGEEAVIEASGRDRFFDYYQRWYRPDRMALIAVGTVDPAALEKGIKKYFSGINLPSLDQPDPYLGNITESGIVAMLQSEPEAAATTVSIQTISPSSQKTDSREKRSENLYRSLINQMMNRRLEILAKEKDSPFREGQVYTFEWLNWIFNSGIELSCQPEQWEAALNTAEQELRRALTYGFTQSELEEAKAKVIKNYEQLAKAAPTRKSRNLARGLVQSIGKDEVFTTPADDLALVMSVLENIDREHCQDLLNKDWNTGSRNIFVSGNLEIDNSDSAILAVFEASSKYAVEQPKEAETAAFAYTQFGLPGEVSQRVYDEDLDITQISFKNKIRLNLKPTNFEKNTIHVGARFGGGLLTLPKGKRGLSFVTDSTFIAGGLIKHSADDLERIFSGKTLDLHFSVASDAFVLSGKTTPEDLESQLQFLAAYLIAPGYREEALRLAHKSYDQVYLQLMHTPQGVMRNEVSHYIAGNDYRFGFPPKEDLLTYTLNEVRDWLAEPLVIEPMEVSIVGDLSLEETIELARLTLGALPSRKSAKPDYESARSIRFPQTVDSQFFQYSSDIPKAVGAVYWPTDDMWDISRTRRLSVLSAIIDDRMRVKIREETGQAYSPFSISRPSDTYKGYGYLLGVVMAAPEHAENIAKLILEIGNELYEKGIDEDELNRALEPLLSSIRVQIRNNGYWLNTVLLSSQEYPQRLDWARNMTEDYASITVEDINHLAQIYLQKDKALQVMIVPEELEKGL